MILPLNGNRHHPKEGWLTSGSCNQADLTLETQVLCPHVGANEPCTPPENWQGPQMPWVISVPAEVACVCLQIIAGMWHTGPMPSETCPWGASAKCGGVGPRASKWVGSAFEENREACCCLPFLCDHFCVCLRNLAFIGIWFPSLGALSLSTFGGGRCLSLWVALPQPLPEPGVLQAVV